MILRSYTKPDLQGAGIQFKCVNSDLSMYSINFRPRHNIKSNDYDNFFFKEGNKAIVRGECNVKHSWWNTRLEYAKGKEIYKCLQKAGFSFFPLKDSSTSQATQEKSRTFW